MKCKRAGLVVFALVVALVVLSPVNMLAQMSGSGSVSGTVVDPSSAAIAGATVTLKDVATGALRTSITNETGRFFMANVLPGTYDVTITKTGFSQAKLSKQVVSVGSDLTLNVTLELGAVTQTVEVTATNTELQTMNATVGNTVNGSTLESLPSLGRDVSSFVTMQPGVSPDGSVGGTVVDQANFMLDGGNNSNDMDGSGGVYNPSFGDDPSGGLFSNPNNSISGINNGIAGNQPSGVMPTPIDSVEEFKVATSNQTADFNNSSGMQVSIVTKRGTNAWHGTAYEYYLDNTFSGNTWQGNQSNTPVPDWHRSWFGVAGGGPVIPKDILGGKTYIFALYQGTRFPFSEQFDRLVPSANMRAGILQDPTTGTMYNLNTLDPRGIGINSFVKQMWNSHMPLPTAGAGCGPFTGDGICDGVNTLDYRSILAIPQNDNMGVVRMDHDFGQKWHFMSSFRYYHLVRTTDDQVDIGGFFSGDKLGTPTALTSRPQVPWYLVLGMTTSLSSNVTNDFRYSFLRNFWQWGSAGDPAQFSNLGAALEPFGETIAGRESLTPYNVNTQNTRTRFWDGKDHFFRDDVSWVKGTHLFQFGGQYQHNWNYHQRTDNGGGINYYPVYQLGSTSNAGNVDMSGLGAAFDNPGLARDAAAVLGIVTQSQQAFTRSGSNLTLNGPLVPAFDQVTIPYYNLYLNDSWHLKPSITLTYGLGWSLEMPPVEATGKQIVLVDANDKPIGTEDYLNARKAAALQGNVYNPEIGFALLPNVAGHPKYPFDPFYGGFSPRVSVAWNPNLGSALGGKNTVFRGGYGRIYGRVNGVNLVLTPLLSPGLIQPVSCTNVLNYTTTPGDGKPSCGTAIPNINTAFRIGTDGTTAPLANIPPSTTLPQPYFPGIAGNAEGSTASPLDPHFKPNNVDSFDFTIQHQFTSKVSVEAGYIGRLIHNELQNINLNSVPYMMTKGGQQFQTAYANVEKAMGCATSETACGNATVASTLATLAPQPFFEAALSGTGYCNGFASCTAAVVTNQFTNFQTQSVWTLWSNLDNGGSAPGFNFPFSMMNTGPNAQMSSNVTMSTSLGHGNYHAGFFTVKMNDWHGMTLQNNFTYSKALGTGAVVQATSQETATDPFNLNTQYGPQAFDRKLVDTMFLVYEPPYYRSQHGVVGHILGGWTFAPIFTAGSGAPDFCITNGGNLGAEGYSGSQEFGSADGANVYTNSNCVLTSRAGTSASFHTVTTSTGPIADMFANPSAVFANVRPLILGLDGNSGGFGQFRGLPYWNVNLGVKKNIRVTERFSAEASFNFINVLNHNQLLDPSLSIVGQNPQTFGQLSTEGTLPRTMEFGIRVNF
ncbi:MAG TPA: TonB-dependent receptor [Candidatus Acidoferrum sp.]|nr:TonB-dependent receptor [Candidatus Acidoferrum sp.]